MFICLAHILFSCWHRCYKWWGPQAKVDAHVSGNSSQIPGTKDQWGSAAAVGDWLQQRGLCEWTCLSVVCIRLINTYQNTIRQLLKPVSTSVIFNMEFYFIFWLQTLLSLCLCRLWGSPQLILVWSRFFVSIAILMKVSNKLHIWLTAVFLGYGDFRDSVFYWICPPWPTRNWFYQVRITLSMQNSIKIDTDIFYLIGSFYTFGACAWIHEDWSTRNDEEGPVAFCKRYTYRTPIK
jgi:hypothetical protein